MSRLTRLGDSSTSHTIEGTPPKVVTRSRSISSRARSGSHLYMITIFPPKARLATRIEWDVRQRGVGIHVAQRVVEGGGPGGQRAGGLGHHHGVEVERPEHRGQT